VALGLKGEMLYGVGRNGMGRFPRLEFEDYYGYTSRTPAGICLLSAVISGGFRVVNGFVRPHDSAISVRLGCLFSRNTREHQIRQATDGYTPPWRCNTVTISVKW